MAEKMDSEREAFEQFLADEMGDTSPAKYPDGEYRQTVTRVCWTTWQARAHITQPAQSVDVGAIRDVIDDLREWGETDAQLAARAETLTRAIGNAQAEGWTSVKDRMPEPCKLVLASHRNSNGKGRCIRAMYAAPKTLEMHMDAEGGEYDEETDTWWCEPGWYEANENEEIHWFVAEKVTHWQPLPTPPQPEE